MNKRRHSVDINDEIATSSKRAHPDGAFQSNDMPPYTFSLDDDDDRGTFVTVRNFRNKTLVHIRKFNKFGHKFYPTKDGVTMSSEDFKVLMSNETWRTLLYGVRAKDIILPSGKHKLRTDLDESIHLQSDYQRDGNVNHKVFTLSRQQWEKLNFRTNDVFRSIIYLYCDSTDFLKDFLKVGDSNMPECDAATFQLIEDCFEKALSVGILKSRWISLPIDGDSANLASDIYTESINLDLAEMADEFCKLLTVKRTAAGEYLLNCISLACVEKLNISKTLTKIFDDLLYPEPV